MKALRYRVFEGFGGLPGEFKALLEGPAATSFDRTLVWLDLFEREILQPDHRVMLYGFEDDAGRPGAVVSTYVRRIPLLPLCQLNALANFYTSSADPIIAEGVEGETLGRAAAEGMLATLGRWVSLDLNPLHPETGFLAGLVARFRERGFFVQRYFRFGNWYSDVAGYDSERFEAELPSRLRHTYQRKSRRLRREQESRTVVVSKACDIEKAMREFSRIYRIRWRKDEPHAGFIDGIVRGFAERGWVRIGLKYAGDRAIAAQLWFVYRGVASMFKPAYDTALSRYSVGTQLTMEMIRHVLDRDRVRRIDFLGGDDQYKRDWMRERRELWGVRVYRLRFPLRRSSVLPPAVAGSIDPV